MTTTVELRRLGADDWRLYRDLRLAALADSPHLFGSDLTREQAFDEADWRVRTERITVALTGTEPVGVVGWHWTERPHRAELVAMWVAPGGRGLRVGAALLRDVVAQVVTAREAVLELVVLVDNEAATRLYEREGFVDVGREAGIRSGDLLRRMRYAPTGPGSTTKQGVL